MEEHSIEIDHLTFSHRKDGSLFRDLGLNLAPNNVYGLLGRNGAGKTTLLRLMAGLLFPQAGACRIFGSSAGSRSPEHLSDVYFVAEEMDAPPLRINAYVRLYAPFYPRFDQEAFFRIIAEFSLKGEERISELSHGRRKAFYLSFSLATNARLLIFDEPTNGLDIPAKSRFRKLLISAIAPERVIIVSTHQVRDIRNLIDPILILDEGRIIFEQTMERVNEKLSLHLTPEEPEPGTCLFHEKAIGGYAVLREQPAGNGNMDLEVLFNAVLANASRFESIFAREEMQ